MRGLGGGEGEQEGAAVVEFAFGADGAAVGEHDVFGDGEAEAGATGFAGAGFIDAIEAFEKARQMLGGDAGAEILHIKFDSEFDTAAGGAGAENDAATGAAILHGIVDEIGKNLMNGFAVGAHRRQGFDGGGTSTDLHLLQIHLL